MLPRREAKRIQPFFTGQWEALFETLLFKMTKAADGHSPRSSSTYSFRVLEGNTRRWTSTTEISRTLLCSHCTVNTHAPYPLLIPVFKG